jgi:hypothetical protein
MTPLFMPNTFDTTGDMQLDEQRAFKLNRVLLAGMSIVMLLFVALGVWLTTVPDGNRDNTPAHVLGVICIVVFGTLLAMVVRQLVDLRPGLVLNGEGILDNASAVSVGLVPWSDVVRLYVVDAGGNKYLVVEVSNPSEYMSRGGPIARWMRRGNAGMLGSPIFIGNRSLQVPFDELVEACIGYLDRYASHDAVCRTSAST